MNELLDRLEELATDRPDAVAYQHYAAGALSQELTWRALWVRACGVARLLADEVGEGEAALLVHPPGLDFIADLCGCLIAGVPAVPAPTPTTAVGVERIERIAATVSSRMILTTAAGRDSLGRRLASRDCQVLTCDGAAADRAPVAARRSAKGAAVIQFTSGSVDEPKGVVLTHENICENLDRIVESFDIRPQDRAEQGALWLPHFHDMGLFGRLTCVWAGFPCALMSPAEFLRRPSSWLNLIHARRATIAGGPNFAFDRCVEEWRANARPGLRLDSWRVAFCGAEPVRADTLRDFVGTFAEAGFHPDAITPCYGMAETTLIASCKVAGKRYRTLRATRAALQDGRLQPGQPADDVVELISAGRPCRNFDVRIAAADGADQPDGEIGEICLRGPSVSPGYLGARGRRRAKNAFLRTGDLGVLHDGELFITGRLKAQIVVRGRKLQAEDVERCVGRAHDALEPSAVAAFAADEADGGGLIVVAEIRRAPGQAELASAAARAARARILDAFGCAPQRLVIAHPRNVRKTSSGKVAREATRKLLADGRLEILQEVGTTAQTGRGVATFAPSSASAVLAALRDVAAQLLATRADAVDSQATFAELGMDSAQLLAFLEGASDALGAPVTPELAFDHPSLQRLAARLAGSPSDAAAAGGIDVASAEPMAIVGMACRVPGGYDLDGFWRLLTDGGVAIGPAPLGRNVAGESHRHGGFIEQAEWFDAPMFGVSPRDAELIDPQQRLLLEMALAALCDAGATRRQVAGRRIGVFVGVSGSEYGLRNLLHGHPEAGSGLGAALSLAANRISHAFDLRGPSLAIDTACSSSLVALHQAVVSLRSGECEAALVGGANLILSDRLSASFAAAGVMAADSRCKPFDAAADGYVRGEGVVALLLKPLSKAQAAGDRIYATVLGSAVEQDGRTNGVLAPNGQAQRAVVTTALSAADVSAGEIAFVEAHGTGTSLGDLVEAEALGHVLGPDRQRPCLIGSLKGNIGHLEAAAGLAGVLKAALALHHRWLPASAGYQSPNPRIAFSRLGLAVAAAPSALAAEGRVCGGVSSFGFGGTIAHAVLASPPEATCAAPPKRLELHLSSRDPGGLRARAQWALLQLAAAVDAPTLAAASRGRTEHAAERAVAVASDAAELRNILADAAQARGSTGLVIGTALPAEQRKLCLVFPGQGAPFWPLPEEILCNPGFCAAMAEMAPALGDRHEVLLAGLRHSGEGPILGDAIGDQVGLVAVQIGLAGALRHAGVVFDGVIGHSVGEIAAACVAGRITPCQAVAIATWRACAIAAAAPPGALLLVGASEDEIGQDLGLLSVAARNSADSLVLSGPAPDIADFARRREAQGGFVRLLQTVTFPAHSSAMAPAAERLRGPCAWAPGTLPWLSSTLGREIASEEVVDDYWAENLLRPVEFAATVGVARAEGFGCFVEASTARALVFPIQQLAGSRVRTVSLADPENDGRLFARTRAQLFCAGLDTAPESACPFAPVAPPEWTRRRYWKVAAHPEARRLRSGLGERVPLAQAGVVAWNSDLAAAADWIGDHVVDGRPLFPGAAFVAAMDAACRGLTRAATTRLWDVQFKRHLAFDPASILQTLHVAGPNDLVSVHARQGETAAWTEHARAGCGSAEPLTGPTTRPDDLMRGAGRRVPPAELYDRLGRLGLTYGPAFQRCGDVWVGEVGAVAPLAGPAEAGDRSGWDLHLLDAALQPAALLVGEVGDGDSVHVPLRIGEVILGPPPAGRLHTHVTCTHAGRLKATFDVRIIDAAGAIHGVLKDIKVAKVRALGRPGPRLPPGVHLYRSEPVILSDATQRSSPLSAVTVVDERSNEAATALRAALARRGWSVRPGPAVPRDGHLLLLLALDATGQDGAVGPALKRITEVSRHLDATASLARLTVIVPSGSLAAEACAGFLRSLRIEAPTLAIAQIDVSPMAPQVMAAAIVDALAISEDEPHLRIGPDGALTAPRLLRAEAPVRGRAADLRAATYVISGGAGALGTACAGRLARRGLDRVLLLSRRPPSEATRDAWRAMAERGLRVVSCQVDVGDRHALAEVLASHSDPTAPYRGIVHAAGILRDGPVIGLTPETLDNVLRPKLLGALNLDALSERYPIERFVLFSSAAAVLGSPGQAAYAAANAALAALAARRRARGAPATVLHWGPWAEGGLAADAAAQQAAASTARSAQLLQMLSPDAALDVLEHVLDAPDPDDLCVLPYEVSDLVQFYPTAAGLRLFERVIDARLTLPGQADSARRPDLARPFVAPETPLETALASMVQAALGLQEVGTLDTLFELGGDSVLAGRLLARVQAAYEVTIDAEVAYQDMSVRGLAALLEDALAHKVAAMTEGEVARALEALGEAPAPEEVPV